ncbi:MAG: glycosyltransferase [Actinobacteria bacterium]|nr:glycosyltransferase [Actinomycetota bacterium]MBU1942319.1 glycosyltransferase [Actinomycetota bacterium]MBU2686875.1 glycosyltransferase [Actinomycetota bacterium]
MTEVVFEFIEQQVEKLDLQGPVVEFGSVQVEGQEQFAGLRDLFGDVEYIGCDLLSGPGVDVIDDMEHSHFAPASVGTVLCLETLEHVMHPVDALREAYRILIPGGTLIVSIPFSMPPHGYPSDYWRMTPEGLEIVIREAGFEQIETWASGEELIPALPHPFSTFGVAHKVPSPGVEFRFTDRLTARNVDGYRNSPALRKKEMLPAKNERPSVPFVVPLYRREEETRQMFAQLEEVTDGYSLVLIDNGFDDEGLIGELAPEALIRNKENTGVTAAINLGIEACGDAPYIGVLHADSLIFEQGWLEHVVDFLERRPDVGIVGLCGWRSIDQTGELQMETTVYQSELPNVKSYMPTWRFSEVAMVDGFVLVMRNVGFRLDESLGFMHYYDLDLSMQYLEAGYRAYAANIDCNHMTVSHWGSTRKTDAYLEQIGGDDDAYYVEVRGRFWRKWRHILPMTRGFTEEGYAYMRIEEMALQIENMDRQSQEHVRNIAEMRAYLAGLEVEVEKRGIELDKAARYARELEKEYARVADIAAGVQRQAATGVEPGNIPVIHSDGEVPVTSSLAKIRHYVSSEGILATIKRTMAYLRRKYSRR